MLVNLTPIEEEIERRKQIAEENDFEYTPQSDPKYLQEVGIYQSSYPFNFPEDEFEELTRSADLFGKNRIIVLEGILLFCESMLRDLMDIRIYMDTPLDICLIRRLERDILQRGRTLESVLTQYQETVRPMCLQFIEPSKRYADIIVPRGGENRIAIEMIQAKMRELLVM